MSKTFIVSESIEVEQVKVPNTWKKNKTTIMVWNYGCGYDEVSNPSAPPRFKRRENANKQEYVAAGVPTQTKTFWTTYSCLRLPFLKLQHR